MAAPPHNLYADEGYPISGKPKQLIQPKLLVGEGKDEENFFTAILKTLGITDVQVEEYGGKNNLGNYLETLHVRQGFASLSAIAITRDADTSPTAGYQSVLGCLPRAGLGPPPGIREFLDSSPRVGIYIFPDCSNGGMLEDLCLASIKGDPAANCVDEFMRCIESAGCHPRNASKSRVLSWLASREKADMRLGHAALENYWDWESPAFEPLKDFLLRL